MTTELIYPDFLGKSRHYTKRDIESGIPVVELTEAEVAAIAYLCITALRRLSFSFPWWPRGAENR